MFQPFFIIFIKTYPQLYFMTKTSLLSNATATLSMTQRINLHLLSQAIGNSDTEMIRNLIAPLQTLEKRCFVGGIRLSLTASNPNKIHFTFEYDPCDGHGVIKYNMQITPTFGGYDITIGGLDYENCKEELTKLFRQIFK
jgi:hypothetical protein